MFSNDIYSYASLSPASHELTVQHGETGGTSHHLDRKNPPWATMATVGIVRLWSSFAGTQYINQIKGDTLLSARSLEFRCFWDSRFIAPEDTNYCLHTVLHYGGSYGVFDNNLLNLTTSYTILQQFLWRVLTVNTSMWQSYVIIRIATLLYHAYILLMLNLIISRVDHNEEFIASVNAVASGGDEVMLMVDAIL